MVFKGKIYKLVGGNNEEFIYYGCTLQPLGKFYYSLKNNINKKIRFCPSILLFKNYEVKIELVENNIENLKQRLKYYIDNFKNINNENIDSLTLLINNVKEKERLKIEEENKERLKIEEEDKEKKKIDRAKQQLKNRINQRIKIYNNFKVKHNKKENFYYFKIIRDGDTYFKKSSYGKLRTKEQAYRIVYKYRIDTIGKLYLRGIDNNKKNRDLSMYRAIH